MILSLLVYVTPHIVQKAVREVVGFDNSSSRDRVLVISSVQFSWKMQVPLGPLCKLRRESMLTGCIRSSHSVEDGLEEEEIDEDMGGSCLCNRVRPILKLSEFLGILPMKIFHPRGESGYKTGSCQLVYQWRSAGAIVNTVLSIAFVIFLPFSFGEIKKRMSQVFSGTDLYAFTLQMVALNFETTVLLLSGRFLRGRFIKGWAELNQVYHEMCDAASDLKRIKVCSYVVTVIIILKLIGFYAVTFWATHGSSAFQPNLCTAALETLIINLTWFIPYTLSTLFFSICILIRSHFITISAMLRSILKKPNSPKLHTQIDAVRVLHEQLCQAVMEFEAYFGIQILLTLCTGCFSVTIGVYAYIVQGEGISSSPTHEAAAWALQLYNASIFMLLILVGGQLVTNSASSAAPVLNSLSLTMLDEKSQRQVAAFLHKISAFPTRMSALKITNVSTTFLSSAVTNIITYLLVLMQFKLSLERTACDGNEDLMNPNNNNGSIIMEENGTMSRVGLD